MGSAEATRRLAQLLESLESPIRWRINIERLNDLNGFKASIDENKRIAASSTEAVAATCLAENQWLESRGNQWSALVDRELFAPLTEAERLVMEVCPEFRGSFPPPYVDSIRACDPEATAREMRRVRGELLARIAGDGDVLDDPVTLNDLAALLLTVTKGTIEKRMSQSPPPPAKIKSTGRAAAVWSYREILPWLRDQWSENTYRLPEDYQRAKSLIAP